jgi:hypothetical protein
MIALRITITQAYQITNGQVWRVMRQKFQCYVESTFDLSQPSLEPKGTITKI